jgi:type I restriction enzyme R subunit
VVEHPKLDTKSLDRQPFIPFKRLLELVSSGADNDELLSSLAGRLARLAQRLSPADEQAISAASGGPNLTDLANTLLHAVDPDRRLNAAQQATGLADPPAEAVEAAAEALRGQAAALIGGNVALRNVLLAIQERNEQVLDTVNVDELVEAGFDQQATDLAQTMIQSFRDFLEEKKDELDALQIIYNMPTLSLRGSTIAERRARYEVGSPPNPPEGGTASPPFGGPGGRRLTFDDLKTLEAEITRTRPTWTTEALWNAYAKLKNAPRLSGPKRLTNLISLIRAVVQLEDELIPYPDLVLQRYQDWLAAQEAAGHEFTPAQRQWLDKIAEVVGVNLAFTRRDFNDYFQAEGGLNAANKLFGKAELNELLNDLNEALV